MQRELQAGLDRLRAAADLSSGPSSRAATPSQLPGSRRRRRRRRDADLLVETGGAGPSASTPQRDGAGRRGGENGIVVRRVGKGESAPAGASPAASPSQRHAKQDRTGAPTPPIVPSASPLLEPAGEGGGHAQQDRHLAAADGDSGRVSAGAAEAGQAGRRPAAQRRPQLRLPRQAQSMSPIQRAGAAGHAAGAVAARKSLELRHMGDKEAANAVGDAAGDGRKVAYARMEGGGERA